MSAEMRISLSASLMVAAGVATCVLGLVAMNGWVRNLFTDLVGGSEPSTEIAMVRVYCRYLLIAASDIGQEMERAPFMVSGLAALMVIFIVLRT